MKRLPSMQLRSVSLFTIDGLVSVLPRNFKIGDNVPSPIGNGHAVPLGRSPKSVSFIHSDETIFTLFANAFLSSFLA